MIFIFSLSYYLLQEGPFDCTTRPKLIGRDLILVWHVAHIQAYYHTISDSFQNEFIFIIFYVIVVGIDFVLADTFNLQRCF